MRSSSPRKDFTDSAVNEDLCQEFTDLEDGGDAVIYVFAHWIRMEHTPVVEKPHHSLSDVRV